MTNNEAKKENIAIEKSEEPIKFKGKFIKAIGRRKSSIAQVRLYKNGAGNIIINNRKINNFFPLITHRSIISQPLKLAGHLKDFDFSILVKGGGKNGQAEAIRHGISRALIAAEKEFKPILKAKDLLTRDSRKKERKKPGLKKARRAPQWAKR